MPFATNLALKLNEIDIKIFLWGTNAETLPEAQRTQGIESIT